MGIFDFLKRKEFEKIKNLETEVSGVKKSFEKKESEVNLLKSDLETKVSEVKKIIEKKEFEVNLLKSDLETKVSELKKNIEKKEFEVNLLKSDLDLLKFQNSELQEKLKPFVPILEIELLLREKEEKVGEIVSDLEILENDYHKKYSIFQKLKEQIKLYDEDLEVINYGVYEPIFNFNSSDVYKESIRLNYEKQKLLFKENKAITSNEDEIYYQTKYKFLGTGYKRSINSYKKLISIAFNSECDALISKVKWNNIEQLKYRITDLYYRINSNSRDFCAFILLQNSIVNELKYGSSEEFEKRYSDHMIVITEDFLKLKHEELALHHELELKKYEEKEEQRINRELLREEEKSLRDYDTVRLEADREEIRVKKQLEIAKIKARDNSENEILNKRILELEEKLKAVQEIRERAISMAQQTRRGYIYVISNIGSFGENIYKIGMTRRLDPFERVRELGNASVPFKFDVHTMIFSEDAPSLEKELHKTFSDKRINHYNLRREFFKVTLDEIQNKIQKLNLSANFISIPEAMEYRETLSILDRLLKQKFKETINSDNEINFPTEL